MIKKFWETYKIEATILFLVILLGGMSAFAFTKLKFKQNQFSQEVELYENKLFPNIELTNSKGTTNLSSIIQKGEYLVVYIFSNCKGCQHEARVLQKSKLYERTGIKTIFIGNEDISLLNSFVIDNNLDASVFLDSEFKLLDELKINITPTNYLIKDGKIKRSWLGSPIDEVDMFQKLGIPFEVEK